MLPYFLKGALIGLSAAATPGPFLAFLLAQTLKNGFLRTLPATFAPLVSDGPIIALVMVLLNQTSTGFLNFIQIMGGLFLIYLAREAWLARQREVIIDPLATDDLSHQTILKGAMMNALSPNPYIFWTVVAGPIVLDGWRQSPSWGLSFVGGFYLTLIGGFMGFVLLFALTSQIDPRLNKLLGSVSALALFIFGLYQLASGVMAVW